MEKRRVVITGLGTVNPLGNTAADSWAAAKAGRCGIGPITQFDTTDFKCKLAGEVKNFDPETVVDKKEARKMARFTLLALAAAAEAIADSGLNTEAEAKNIGVVLSSGIGGLPTIEEQHTRGEEKGMEKVSPYFVPMSIANMAAAQVAIRFGLKGMCTCPVTACAGGTNAVGDAFHRIRDGYETAMVCGGAESCISPLGIGGFTSMKALSTVTDPDAASLPFDARRGGFVMGEGSGVLVLEELEHARTRCAYLRRGGGLWCQLRCLPLYCTGSRRHRCHRLHEADTGRCRHCPGAGGSHQRPRHRHPHERCLRDGCHPCCVRRARKAADRGQHQEHDRPPAGWCRRHRGRVHGTGPARPVCPTHHPLRAA